MSQKKSHAFAIALVFIANILAFSFSSEILADSLSHASGALCQDEASQDCNHSCHAAGHFQGNIAGSTITYPFLSFTPDSRYDAPPLGERISELYHPPRSQLA